MCSCSKEILGCIRERMTSKLILPLYSTLVSPNLKCCVHYWASQYMRGTDILEQVQQRATKMMKRLKCLSYGDRLRAGAVQPGEEKALGGLCQDV